MIKRVVTLIATAAVAAAAAAAAVSAVPASADGAAAGPALVPAATGLSLDQTAHLGHFDVTVSGIRVLRGFDDGFFTGAEATVCATKLPAGQTRTRVSWDPWSVTTTKGTDGRHGWEGSTPIFTPQFPYTASLKKGQCATGVVPVLITNLGTVVSIGYRNGYGETATWYPR